MNRPYVAYYRVSTDKQGINGYGMEAQREDVSQFVLSRGGQLADQFVEVESGAKTDRVQVWRAISECKRLKATLVIAKLDRLGRNVAFISSLMESGVDFVACDMPHASRFELHIRAAVAEEERRMISQRVKDGLAAAKRRGVKLGGYRGALRRHKDQKVVEAEAFVESVRAAFDSMVRSGLGQREMARQLNAFGVKTKTGKEWTNVQVARVLRLMNTN